MLESKTGCYNKSRTSLTEKILRKTEILVKEAKQKQNELDAYNLRLENAADEINSIAGSETASEFSDTISEDSDYVVTERTPPRKQLDFDLVLSVCERFPGVSLECVQEFCIAFAFLWGIDIRDVKSDTTFWRKIKRYRDDGFKKFLEKMQNGVKFGIFFDSLGHKAVGKSKNAAKRHFPTVSNRFMVKIDSSASISPS